MLQIAAVAASLLAAAEVRPAQVQAAGHQTAIIALDRAGMLRIAAKGGGGTACTVVDHLRGPFASDGKVGQRDCVLDLLLDAGTYRLLLDSPRGGKGQVTLSAKPFAEVAGEPVRLEAGRPVERDLPEGKQASFWIHLDRRQPITVRIAGRTVGSVDLWRGGEWREDLSPLHSTPAPAADQPIHEWWVERTLEPGDYLLTAYGTAPTRFARGTETTLLTVEYGFAAPTDRVAQVALRESGAAALALPEGPVTAVATLEAPAVGRVRLEVYPLGDGGSQMSSAESACQIEPGSLVPECAVQASGLSRHVLVVRGPPGAAAQVRWAPRGRSERLVDGEYRDPARRLPLEPLPPGEYLLGLHDVPPDADAAPLGCALERQAQGGGPREVVAFDGPRVSLDRPFQRSFNTSREASIWFEVAAGGVYDLATTGDRRASCELRRFDATTSEPLVRGEPERCTLHQRLDPGLHELRLSGGAEGIERLRIAGAPGSVPDSPARAGCTLRASLSAAYQYTLVASRTGSAAARGLVARGLPLRLEAPVPVEIPAGETLRLPIDVTGAVRVRTSGSGPAGCHLRSGGAGAWRDGACWLQASGADELVVAARPDAPLVAWISRSPEPRPPPPPPIAWRPTPAPLPRFAEARPARLDFDPGQEHALVFDVTEAGLYDVGTEGLLATRCALRTPAVPQLATDQHGGRGRNCLVSSFLWPGRYLVSVAAEAPSHGRASVTLARRQVLERPGLDVGREAFHHADAGALVRQRVAIPKPGRYTFSASALGAKLRCRLEDADGWPLAQGPGPCRTTAELPAGEVIFTQLPLTVESARRVAVGPEERQVVLRGKGPHTVEPWRRYVVALGKLARQEFRFEILTEMDVSLLLTDRMQGRIYREGDPRPIELVPPIETGGEPVAQPSETETADGVEAAADDETAPVEQEATEAASAATRDEESPEEPAPRPAPRRAERRGAAGGSAPGPEGRKVHLPNGRYRLVVEHSRGDVSITYAVELSTSVLTPGMSRDVPVPARLPVRVPSAGTLRLRTSGDADVRCRLLDASGRLLAASSEVGEDWNCGFAEPIAAGDYLLEVESEDGFPGTTRLALALPPPSDVGPLLDGKRYAVGPEVLLATLAPPPGDAVLDVALEGAEAFWCAVEDDGGRVLWRSSLGTSCHALLLPGGRVHRVRVWTLDRPGQVAAHLATRLVTAFVGGRLPATGAGRAAIGRAGRYRTGQGVQCLSGASSGVLEPCEPAVSLEAGPVVFAGIREVRAALDEVLAPLDQPAEARVVLGGRPFVQRQTSPRGVHLVAVRVAPGERAAPACAIEGGVHVAGEGACFAASSSTEASTLRLRAGAPVEVRAWRAAVRPGAAPPLAEGRSTLAIAPQGALWRLPRGSVSAEILLPPAAWAVLLSDGRARDLCAPADRLQRCLLASDAGGDLLLYAPEERRADATVTKLADPPPARDLAGVVEERASLPGVQTWRIAASPTDRVLDIEGVSRCTLSLDDGTRSASCDAALPAGATGFVRIEHEAGPLRAVIRSGADGLARFGRAVAGPEPHPLAEGEAGRLEGDLFDRTLVLRSESVVHVRADRGVCALGSRGDAAVIGLGAGCRLDRLLPAGVHRLLVRAFAGEPLSGVAVWTAEPVSMLGEGVGAEAWIGPGEARFFRFALATRGKVGLGLREEAEALQCTVTDGTRRPVGEGCQQLLDLPPGSYVLSVRAPPGVPPTRFRPVLVGLAGSEIGVPEEYLRDLFQRVGVRP